LREAWIGGKGEWKEINSASHGNAVRALSKADFNSLYRRLSPLPPEAFTGESRRRWLEANPWWHEAKP